MGTYLRTYEIIEAERPSRYLRMTRFLKCLLFIFKLDPCRENYQGIVPPVIRSEEDFDAGAKYHVAADVPYIRYFASHILQFMFYKEMCQLSHQYDPQDPTKPLFKC